MTILASDNIRRLAKIILTLAELQIETHKIVVEPDELKKLRRSIKRSCDTCSSDSLQAILFRVLEDKVTQDDIEVLRELSGIKTKGE